MAVKKPRRLTLREVIAEQQAVIADLNERLFKAEYHKGLAQQELSRVVNGGKVIQALLDLTTRIEVALPKLRRMERATERRITAKRGAKKR